MCDAFFLQLRGFEKSLNVKPTISALNGLPAQLNSVLKAGPQHSIHPQALTLGLCDWLVSCFGKVLPPCGLRQ